MNEEYSEECKKTPFHPLDQPYGTKNYDWGALEPEQKEILDEKKITWRQGNEKYLNEHPEIRGLISMVLRHLLDKRPRSSEQTQEFAGEYFGRPRYIIAEELLNYLLEVRCQNEIIDNLKQEISDATINNNEEFEIKPRIIIM